MKQPFLNCVEEYRLCVSFNCSWERDEISTVHRRRRFGLAQLLCKLFISDSFKGLWFCYFGSV